MSSWVAVGVRATDYVSWVPKIHLRPDNSGRLRIAIKKSVTIPPLTELVKKTVTPNRLSV